MIRGSLLVKMKMLTLHFEFRGICGSGFHVSGSATRLRGIIHARHSSGACARQLSTTIPRTSHPSQQNHPSHHRQQHTPVVTTKYVHTAVVKEVFAQLTEHGTLLLEARKSTTKVSMETTALQWVSRWFTRRTIALVWAPHQSTSNDCTTLLAQVGWMTHWYIRRGDVE